MPTIHPQHLPINDLQPNPLQPRGKILKEELEELVQSVKAYGVLEPLVVAHTPAGYQIIAGERRWRAAKLAGLTEVPVVVKATSPRGMLEMAIVENLQRVDLSPVERAQAFQQLLREFKFTAQQIAEKVGKSQPFVSNTLRLLNLPDAVKDGLIGGLITEGHARALLGIDDERSIVEAYKVLLKENGSVRRAEDLVRRYKEKVNQAPMEVLSRKILQSPQIDIWEEELRKVFNNKTKVKLSRSYRQTKVMFIFHGSPIETQHELEKVLSIIGKKEKDFPKKKMKVENPKLATLI